MLHESYLSDENYLVGITWPLGGPLHCRKRKRGGGRLLSGVGTFGGALVPLGGLLWGANFGWEEYHLLQNERVGNYTMMVAVQHYDHHPRDHPYDHDRDPYDHRDDHVVDPDDYVQGGVGHLDGLYVVQDCCHGVVVDDQLIHDQHG